MCQRNYIMKKPAIIVPKICFVATTIIALTCLVGCAQAEQAQINATTTITQDISMPPSWTPTVTPSPTMTSRPTEIPTPEPTATLTPTPVGMLSSLSIDDAQEIAWSPDGERIALLSGKSMSLYHASDLSLIFKNEVLWTPTHLNFSHDGNFLAACEARTGNDTQIREGHFAVWDGQTGTQVLVEQLNPSCPAQFLESGVIIFYEREGKRDWYVLGADDYRLQTWISQWQIETGLAPDLEFDLRSLHTNRLVGVTSDGRLAAFWEIELQLHQEAEYFYWIVREGRGSRGFKIPATHHDEAYLTPDDRHLVTSDYRRCSYSFFNLHNGVLDKTVDWCELEEYADLETEKIEISPDGSLMTVEFQGGRLAIWDVSSSVIIHEVTNPNPPLLDFAFHPNNTNYALLTRIPDGYSLSVWELTK